MINPPDTCWGVCNIPLSIWDKHLINMHLLNHIPGKDWIVCVQAYCILPTNTHDHGQMIDPTGTCQSVCNTNLHIRDKHLINMYLLNPIPGKDQIVCVGAYCIRPANSHDHRQMIDSLDTFRGVCNIPLPIRDKYLINTYLLNLIPSKNWIVCNTPLPIQTKNLILIYWVLLKLVRFWGVCICD